MGRKKGDGRGKTGGRVAGTPNKNKGLKELIATHLDSYFAPSIETTNRDGETVLVSQFEQDFVNLDPDKRVKLAADMLNYTIPKMQATAVDMTMGDRNRPLTDRLNDLVKANEQPTPAQNA